MGYFQRILFAAFTLIALNSANSETSDSTVFLHLTYEANHGASEGLSQVVRAFVIEAKIGDLIVPWAMGSAGKEGQYLFRVESIDSNSCVELLPLIHFNADLRIGEDPLDTILQRDRKTEWVCNDETRFGRKNWKENLDYDSLWFYWLRVTPSGGTFFTDDTTHLPRMVETTEIEKPETWVIRRERRHNNGMLAHEWFEAFTTSMSRVNHGEFRIYAPNGSLSSLTTWNRGRRQGRVAAWHKNGVRKMEGFYDVSVRYCRDVKHGLWAKWDSTGALLATGSFEHGTGKWFYPDGTVKAEEVCKEGRPHGTWKEYYPNGQLKSRTEYEKGERHGESVYWHENGQFNCRLTYEHGRERFDNEWQQSYHANGRLARESRWTNAGEERRTWYANGQIKEEYIPALSPATTIEREWFEDGSPKLVRDDTIMCKWRETGTIKRMHRLKDGKTHGRWFGTYDNGQIRWEGENADGKDTGVSRLYGENGVLMRTIDYANDPPIESTYYPSGGLESRGPMSGRQKSGNWQYWDDKGNLLVEEVWSHGELQKADTLRAVESE